MWEAYAIFNQEASTVADAMIKNLISRFGVPLKLHSDEGRNFECKFSGTLCDKFDIRKTRTIELHSQFDEIVEWVKRTIGNYLSEVICNPRERLKQGCFVFF